jgi:uncharacterized protein
MKPTLFIMAKAPRIGTAKSRLARDIGTVMAWRVNRALNRHLAASLPDVWPRKAKRQPQKNGDLGARLQHIFRTAPHGPVLVIGTDCPAVCRGDIAAAIAALRSREAVLGPATDGGFWLLGLGANFAKKANFSGIRWSSHHTMADTIAALRLRKIKYIRELVDVDDAASYREAYCVKRKPGAATSAKRGLSTER